MSHGLQIWYFLSVGLFLGGVYVYILLWFLYILKTFFNKTIIPRALVVYEMTTAD